MVSDRNEARFNVVRGDGRSGPSARSEMFRTEMHMMVGDGKVTPTKYISSFKSCLASIKLSLPVKMKTELFERISSWPDNSLGHSPVKRCNSDSLGTLCTPTKHTKFPKLKNNIFLIRDKLSQECPTNQRNSQHRSQGGIHICENNDEMGQNHDDVSLQPKAVEPRDENAQENANDNVASGDNSRQNRGRSTHSNNSSRAGDLDNANVSNKSSSQADFQSEASESDGTGEHSDCDSSSEGGPHTVAPNPPNSNLQCRNSARRSEHDISASFARNDDMPVFGSLSKSKSKSEASLPTSSSSTSRFQSCMWNSYASWCSNRVLGNSDPFVMLPDHVLARIFSCLATRDLAALKCSCKDFKWIIEEYNVCGIDSKWSKQPKYQDDPCMQCGKLIDPRGDVSLCRWHPKIFYKNGYIGRFWTCCFQVEEDAPGCSISLHDNNWMLRKERLKRIPRRSRRKSMPKLEIDYERELLSD